MQTDEWDQKIRERAYELFLRRGGQPGADTDDWLQAEQELVSVRESAIDEAAEESFPASDPPAH